MPAEGGNSKRVAITSTPASGLHRVPTLQMVRRLDGRPAGADAFRQFFRLQDRKSVWLAMPVFRRHLVAERRAARTTFLFPYSEGTSVSAADIQYACIPFRGEKHVVAVVLNTE